MRLACAALAVFAATRAVAGSFSVSPTRVEFDSTRNTAVLTLRNKDSAPLTIQASLVDWTQTDGTDAHAPTRDLLATPPVFTIPPGGEQVVRIALRRKPDAVQELPYRIFFQEVPQPAAAGTNSLGIALRIGVPIFVRSQCADAGPTLDWQMEHEASGELRLVASNPGCSHVQVTGLNLRFGEGSQTIPVQAVKYVLPGSHVQWMVAPPAGADVSRVLISGTSDRGALSGEAGLPASVQR